MRFEQPIAVIARNLVIAMVREIEAVRSFANAVGYQALPYHLGGGLLRSMSWSTTQGSLPASLLLTAGHHVGRPDTWQHRKEPMLASCPASFVDPLSDPARG